MRSIRNLTTPIHLFGVTGHMAATMDTIAKVAANIRSVESTVSTFTLSKRWTRFRLSSELDFAGQSWPFLILDRPNYINSARAVPNIRNEKPMYSN